MILAILVITNYCPSASYPTTTNGNSSATVPVQTVSGVTYIPCAYGYQSAGATNPYFVCMPSTATTGYYSIVTYSCTGNLMYNVQRMRVLCIINRATRSR